MHFTPLSIPEIIKITPQIHGDGRGFFMEVHHQEKFIAAGITNTFVQSNHSRSTKGTLRGLHYQLSPKEQGKLVRVLSGKIYDAAVDIRPNSPTYGKWIGEVLDDVKREMLYVPPGFAHGFYVLSESADVEYYCTNTYTPELEKGIHWDSAGIKWPLTVPPILSEKDNILPRLTA
ncbi:MAG: dTDP-4-dehydrorhamnose 3,5-epimerase [bacterium]|nr:dTDP-4-dehydrorhamnose 3,5-epimerase [bacterium]